MIYMFNLYMCTNMNTTVQPSKTIVTMILNLCFYLVLSALCVYLSYLVKKKGCIEKLSINHHSKAPRYTMWVWEVLYESRHRLRSIDSGDLVFVLMKHVFRVIIWLPTVLLFGPLFAFALFMDHFTFYVNLPRLPREYDATKNYPVLKTPDGMLIQLGVGAAQENAG